MSRMRSVGTVQPSHTDSTLVLGLEAEVLQPARGRHLCPTEIRWSDPSPLDRYATGQKGPCIDSAGYHRKRHLFNVWSRKGYRCTFCWALCHMEPL